MSHSYDTRRNSGGSLARKSVNTLTDVPNGDLHLLVTFEILAAEKRTDGGDPSFVAPDADPETTNDSEATAEREDSAATVEREDSADTADRDDSVESDTTSDLGPLADREPFVDSVMRPGGSTAEYTDTAFGEAVDVESLVSYLGLDFVEHELFADRFLSDSDDVVYTSRGVGTYQLLCVYSAGRGLLLVVDEDEAIRPLVGHARRLLTET